MQLLNRFIMNSYGYDFYINNDETYYDNTPYIDTLKPLDKIESFENDIDELLGIDDKNVVQKIANVKNQLCDTFQKKYKQCVYAMQKKNYELNYCQNHIFLLYVMLLFAIIFIFYQRIAINGLNQLIYILKWNINGMDPKTFMEQKI